MKCLNEKCSLNKNKKCMSDQVVYEGAYCKNRNEVSKKENRELRW